MSREFNEADFAGLSAEELRTLMLTAAEHLISRGNSLPLESLAQMAIDGVRDNPDAIINPFVHGENLPPSVVGDGQLIVNHAQGFASRTGPSGVEQPITLSAKTFQVLSVLSANKDNLISRDQLLELVWNESVGQVGATQAQSTKVKMAVSRLRFYLGPDLGNLQKGVIRTAYDKAQWMAVTSLLI